MLIWAKSARIIYEHGSIVIFIEPALVLFVSLNYTRMLAHSDFKVPMGSIQGNWYLLCKAQLGAT